MIRRRLAMLLGVVLAAGGYVVGVPGVASAAGLYNCPAFDHFGFSLGPDSLGTTPTIYCNYPTSPGEDPTRFFCTYDAATGVVVTDHDAGACPDAAAAGPAGKSTPYVGTTVSSPAVIPGTAISDTATLTLGDNPTGTVTFNLYDNPAADGAPVFTDPNVALAGGSAVSGNYVVPTLGVYYWVVTYAGDLNNNGSFSGNNIEQVRVRPAYTCPAVDVSPLPFALVTSGYGTDPIFCSYPTHPTDDPNQFFCTYSATTGALVAAHDGSFGCPASAVAAMPGKAMPYITSTPQPAAATVGQSVIRDTATVTFGDHPAGSVTFELYDNPTASGTALFSDQVTLSADGTATSAGYVPLVQGNDYWVVTYNGDAYNNIVAGGPAAERVIVVDVPPPPAPPAPSPTPTPTVSPTASPSPSPSPTGSSSPSPSPSPTSTGGPVTDPTITAQVLSGQGEHAGWYRGPVTVTFTCDAGSTALATPCPDPVQLTHSGADQTVTRSVSDTDGGHASASVTVSIDLGAPTIRKVHPREGTCRAHDPVSGVASCVVHKHAHTTPDGVRVVRWTATATDNAGNTASRHGHYRV